MEINELKVGQIVKSNFWLKPLRIEKIEILDEYVKILGQFINLPEKYIYQVINKADFNNITPVVLDFSGNPEDFFLVIETLRYRYISLYDPLVAMNISKVDPLPHQIDAVYNYVLKQLNIRFLIADDPGAGKTIMAGLIIKELKLRGLVKKILIVCPGHLKYQWQRELNEKFDEMFNLVDRSLFKEESYKNVWEEYNQLIVSIDFLKQEDIIKTLLPTNFDLIIVDEAHKMSVSRDISGGISKTQRYKLGEVLSKITTHLLFLTATPHNGDSHCFRMFLDLLIPNFFLEDKLLEQSIEDKDNPLFIRRIKEELKDFNGKPLFLPRYAQTITFEMSDIEKELYNDLSKYIEEQYKLYSKIKRPGQKQALTFALIIFQRRFGSSMYAFLKSLERRKEKLLELINSSSKIKQVTSLNLEYTCDFDEIDELEDEEREVNEYELEKFIVTFDNKNIQEEIFVIDDLINEVKYIIKNEIEIKLLKLKALLQDLNNNVQNKKENKIIIFTESRDTLEYLEQKIIQWGYQVVTIHGKMAMPERIEAEKKFKEKAQVLVATDAAGEGINLQFCNLMINYDIPWNPNRLEQRMGRIHRYGQSKEVYIYNFVNITTREGKVLETLLNKIETIKKELGSDKVYDVIGKIIGNEIFIESLINAAICNKTSDEIISEINDKFNAEYVKKVKDSLNEALISHSVDYSYFKDIANKACENKLTPEYTQYYFTKVFEKNYEKLIVNDDGSIKILNIPDEIKKIAIDENFKKEFGEIKKNYNYVIFDKQQKNKYENYELITFGHPLFEAVMRWVEQFSEVLYKGAVFYDPDGKIDGYILFYEGTILDGNYNKVSKQLFAFLATRNQIKRVPLSILWDLKYKNEQVNIDVDYDLIDDFKKQAEVNVIKYLDEYVNKVKLERKRQNDIKIKYGVKSLENIVLNLNLEIIELKERRKNGENLGLVITNKERVLDNYEKALNKLKSEIENEQKFLILNPKLLGVARILPDQILKVTVSEISDECKASDEEIEKIGMQVAMEYERENGRDCEDVSADNLGYDIRSKDNKGNIRYIEVKARALEGSVSLTQNEWFKAQRFGDNYYLYIVFNAIKFPELIVIKNPAKNIDVIQKIETVRYIVDKDTILKQKNKNEV